MVARARQRGARADISMRGTRGGRPLRIYVARCGVAVAEIETGRAVCPGYIQSYP